MAILNPSFSEGLDLNRSSIEIPATLELDVNPVLRTREHDSILELVEHADALVVPSRVRGFPGSADLERLERLRMIAIAASGFDSYDIAAWRERGIVVSNVVGSLASESVAEHAIALMLAALRRWSATFAALERGEVSREIGRLLNGSTVAIVGYGNIGRRTARLASCFGANVVVVSRSAGADPEGVIGNVMPLDEALRISDVVSLHVRLSPETAGMIDEEALRSMKPGAILVNTARRELIDEDALAEALTTGRVGCASLDDLATSDALRQAPNLLTFPHIGNRSLQGMRNVAEQVFSDLNRFALGGSPENLVDLSAL